MRWWSCCKPRSKILPTSEVYRRLVVYRFGIVVHRYLSLVRRREHLQLSIALQDVEDTLIQTTNAMFQMQSDLSCVICMDARREVVLVNCNHYILCRNCVRLVDVCPICNEAIHTSFSVYI